MQVLGTGDKVSTFLSSIGRNSPNSRKTYLTSLNHFSYLRLLFHMSFFWYVLMTIHVFSTIL